MPKFLFLTTISRHDARLSSTTHCALRVSRINYNLTNLSRCNSFLQYFSSMDLCSASCHPAHFLSNSFQCFLVILQALSLSLCQNHQAFQWLSRLSLPKSPNFSHNQKYKSHMQRNSVVFTYFSHAYHYCQELHRLYLPHLPYSNGSQVFQPCSVLWYLPKICSRISQICLCISVSKSLRWSRNIAMMSRWFALRRTSSSNGKSHSKRTSKVCISRKTLVTLSNPIIQPMYCSSIASRNGRLSRLSILSTDRMATLSLSLNATVPTRIQWFSQLLHSKDF